MFMVKLLAIQKLPERLHRSLCFFFQQKTQVCLFAYTAPCMLPGFQLLASGIDLLISPGEQWTNHDRELKIQVKCNRQSKRWIEKEEIAIQNKLNLQSNHKDLNFSTATAIQKQKTKEEPQSRCFLNRWATKKNSLTFHWILVVSWGPLQWLKPFWKSPLERLDRKWIITTSTTTTRALFSHEVRMLGFFDLK